MRSSTEQKISRVNDLPQLSMDYLTKLIVVELDLGNERFNNAYDTL